MKINKKTLISNSVKNGFVSECQSLDNFLYTTKGAIALH